jgi:hypothetical protein
MGPLISFANIFKGKNEQKQPERHESSINVRAKHRRFCDNLGHESSNDGNKWTGFIITSGIVTAVGLLTGGADMIDNNTVSNFSVGAIYGGLALAAASSAYYKAKSGIRHARAHFSGNKVKEAEKFERAHSKYGLSDLERQDLEYQKTILRPEAYQAYAAGKMQAAQANNVIEVKPTQPKGMGGKLVRLATAAIMGR